jgi:phosphatidylglycerol---prolipoprotein diacylglyceryl transferase
MNHLFLAIEHRPTSWELGPVAITGFGLAVLLAFAIAQYIAQREFERRGQSSEPVSDLIFAAVIGGLLGAKIYYAILMGSAEALLSRSGFVFWGGLIGGIVAVSLVVMKKKLNYWSIADVAGICIPAAYAVGRTGCWAVGDDYGRPWDGPLAVSFPEGAPPSTVENMQKLFSVSFPPGTDPTQVVSVYPTQLFEVTMGMIMFAICWRLRDHKHARGWLFGVYCMLAGIERFIVEFFRAKDDYVFGGITAAQMIGVAFFIAGAAIVAMKRNPAPGKLQESTA